ncbi:ABC transporter permease subunit [Granulicatella sp. zg-ZJ]|uniref:nickel ABC transporter permease n=1 Tax=unclassified Granulicatella TaxID=2630493 RepID=UPI0013BEE93A|nr:MULTISPECIES: nickel ABC transporter permease [unclassified Granulicatella]MBS4749452.1 ABC transporter permease [Carnobacteriaceae bacterium zg-ZUI78]NEW62181.1 ABC transporter permease subunit [Granulicatella sp. zg-ZJ]NEW66625.1 ABC transporter permease subunit [Granulicatella sp. zg-84]QMI85052.1 ABC transporter permease [Carnobacteriaceae bacterium zg-84]
MKKVIWKRLIQLVFVMFGISFITFSLMNVIASDPITMKYENMQQQVDKSVIEKEKEKLGLNKSFLEQYISWLSNISKGDLGMSYRYQKPVSDKLKETIPNTLVLVSATTFVSAISSLFLGIVSAIYERKWIDYLIRFFSFLGVAMPSFWVALILIYTFSVSFQLLPVSGYGTFRHLILPMLTLSIWMIAVYTRQIRNQILEEHQKDYVKGLKSLGFSYRHIMLKEILPNALLPVLTNFGMTIGALLGGTVIIETIFGWQGVGRLVMEAIKNRDYPIIQGYVLWMSIIFVSINLIVDLLYHVLNPRVRLEDI